jgi:hypothetical protein
MSRQECEERAAKCLLLADQCSHPAMRLGLIDMAHTWLHLAEQAEKTNTTDFVNEAPPASRVA